jgi:CMP-N,N'-diacetyllegionaminic acid synthase
MKFLITICARGGSKGIPGKNIKLLNGVPLIAYSIQLAKLFSEVFPSSIVLSTDSEEIRYVAEKYGLITDYLRPSELASDHAGKIGVLKHILDYTEKKENIHFDYILDLDVTSPMRTIDDLMKGLEVLNKDKNACNVFSVNTANRNPYFNMVEQKEDGYFRVVSYKGEILSRQKAPKVYDMNASFYFYRRRIFETPFNSTITSKSLIYEMPHECFDLDHPIDFEFLEFLLANKKLSFEIWKS